MLTNSPPIPHRYSTDNSPIQETNQFWVLYHREYRYFAESRYALYLSGAPDLRLSLTLLHGDEKSLIMSDFLLAEEEEFLDELAENQHPNESTFNRDQVFAHLNFRLNAGSFKLINTKQSNSSSQTTALPVVEAEFSDLRWDSEMRPRSSTWEFNMSLGALFFYDKLTPGTLFPSLVCPQGRESKVSLYTFKVNK